MTKIDSRIKRVIGTHVLGLFGVTLLIFDVAFNLMQESPSIGNSDKIVILLGTCLLLSELIPERIKIALNSYPLIHAVDKLTSKYWSLFLCFLILIGFYLRFNNLGNLSFWIDEVFTTYAAIGILEHGTPVLPSGMLYTRSILNTSLIALSFKIFGVSEFSARIVSVIFGTLTIPLVYLMGTKVANKRVGLLAAVLITFSVWEIVWAREARMYAQFQFLYLLTAYLFYLGLDKNNLKLLSFSAITFICAWYSQVLALTFLPVALIYILLYKREVLKNRYVISGILICSGLALLYMIVTGKTPFGYIPTSAPIWGQHPFYYYALTPDLRTLFILVVVGITISILLWRLGILKNEKHSAYLYLNFFIPFIIISLNSWKAPRYSFFILPFLVLSAFYVIDLYVIRNVINEEVCTRISNKAKIKKELVRNFKFAISFIMVALILMQILSTSVGAFGVAQKDHGYIFGGMMHSNWKKAGEFVKSQLSDEDIIISTRPAVALYYMGRSNYQIRKSELYTHYINSEMQLVETYAGTVILTDYNSFMHALKGNDRSWIIVEYTFDGYNIDPDVRSYVRNNMTYHPEGSDATIQVYSWNKSK